MSNIFSHRVLIPSGSKLTPEQEAEIKESLSLFSSLFAPAPLLVPFYQEYADRSAAERWISEMLEAGFLEGRNKIYYVAGFLKDDPEKKLAKIVAISGNGPNSVHCSRIFAAAPAMLSALLEERASLLEEIRILRESLDDHEKAAAELLQNHGIKIKMEDVLEEEDEK